MNVNKYNAGWNNFEEYVSMLQCNSIISRRRGVNDGVKSTIY